MAAVEVLMKQLPCPEWATIVPTILWTIQRGGCRGEVRYYHPRDSYIYRVVIDETAVFEYEGVFLSVCMRKVEERLGYKYLMTDDWQMGSNGKCPFFTGKYYVTCEGRLGQMFLNKEEALCWIGEQECHDPRCYSWEGLPCNCKDYPEI
jgi:hypothetical protein